MNRVYHLFMIVAWSLLGYCLSLSHAHAALAHTPVSFEFSRVRVAELVQVIYRDALKRPFLIDADVLRDEREVSLRFESAGRLEADAAKLLDALGLSVVDRGGMSVVSLRHAMHPPILSARCLSIAPAIVMPIILLN